MVVLENILPYVFRVAESEFFTPQQIFYPIGLGWKFLDENETDPMFKAEKQIF